MRRLTSALSALAALTIFGSSLGTTSAAAEEVTVTKEYGVWFTAARVGGRHTSTFAPGQPYTTILENGATAQGWKVIGTRGDCLDITMRSNAFDSFVGVYRESVRGDQLDKIVEDDDSAGGWDARIRLTLPATAPYYLVVSAAGKHPAGAYTLDIQTCGPSMSNVTSLPNVTSVPDNGPNPFLPAGNGANPNLPTWRPGMFP
ncbi:MAG: hypothetical protein U0893_04195 [Chloroflexota bacterium]